MAQCVGSLDERRFALRMPSFWGGPKLRCCHSMEIGYWGYIGIMENNMETTVISILGLYRDKRKEHGNYYFRGLYVNKKHETFFRHTRV